MPQPIDTKERLERFEEIRKSITDHTEKLGPRQVKNKNFVFDGFYIFDLLKAIDLAIDAIKNPYGKAPKEPFHGD